MKTVAPVTQHQFAFQLKGSLLTITVLQLLNTDSQTFAHQLKALIQQTPNFFRNAPIIIDLEKLAQSRDAIDFTRIKTELLNHGLIPVGIRNGNETQNQSAVKAELGILTSSKTEQPKAATTGDKHTTSKLITQPVRSGQQIYVTHGDLIVASSVSPGAELLADGNIHVYGTLRGRALAGVSGNLHARIFCHKLEAELVSIAGFYKLHDDIKLPASESGIQIYYEDEQLKIEAI